MRQLLKSKKNFHRTLHPIYIYSISHYNYHYLYSQNPVKQKIIFFFIFFHFRQNDILSFHLQPCSFGIANCNFPEERHPVVQKYLPATMLCSRSSLKLRNPCSRSSLKLRILSSRSSLRPPFFSGRTTSCRSNGSTGYDVV